jgi:septum formation protein
MVNHYTLPWLRRKYRLRLASASPRRLALLRQVGIEPWDIRPAAIDETPRPGEPPETLVRRLAKAKALAALDNSTDLVLGADTAVVLDGTLLGKPRDPGEAVHMLNRLSGQTHVVMTGVALARQGAGACQTLSCITRVTVKSLDEALIAAYVATREPLDKAGAYAIQGMGAFLVAHIEGSHSNVVGLPLFETLALLERMMDAP